MTGTFTTALGMSNILLRIFRALNLLAAAILVASLAASFVVEPVFRDFFSRQPPRTDPALLMPVLRLWMLLAVPAFAAVHILLSRLVAIVGTVRGGDPFVAENAARMKTIAWCLAGVELFHLVSGAMAAAMNAAGSDIEWSFSATGWIAVVLLFVLAQVFEEGARIRSDLEAMI